MRCSLTAVHGTMRAQRAPQVFAALEVVVFLVKTFAGDTVRPDLDAIVSSGLFEQCMGIVRAFERAGVEGLSDAGPAVLFQALTLIKYMRSHRDCEEKVRSLGSGLAFAIEHSLVYSNKYGVSSGATATQICESLPNHNVHLASS
jgi:hypothetical protein